MSARWSLFHQESWGHSDLLTERHCHPGPHIALSRRAATDNSPAFQRRDDGENGCVPTGRLKLFPQISFVIFNVVSFQQHQKFLLKRHPTMVFLLSFDVRDGVVQLRYADAERTVFLLPRKQAMFWKSFMDPFGRATLDQLQRLGNRER